MNAVQKALDDACVSIPRQILNATFIGTTRRFDHTQGLHDIIMNQVIRPRVLVDCNLVGGIKTLVDLSGLEREFLDNYTTVVRVPKERTQGRTILTVYNVTFLDVTRVAAFGAAAQNQNSTFLHAGEAVMDAHAAIPVISTARCNMVGENVLMIRDTVALPEFVQVNVLLANDEQMSHLPLRAYINFKKLVILAIKAHIYNEYVVRMDMGEIHAGQQLGSFKNIIEQYADANEQYQEFLEGPWTKTAFMSDEMAFNEFLRYKIGSFR